MSHRLPHREPGSSTQSHGICTQYQQKTTTVWIQCTWIMKGRLTVQTRYLDLGKEKRSVHNLWCLLIFKCFNVYSKTGNNYTFYIFVIRCVMSTTTDPYYANSAILSQSFAQSWVAQSYFLLWQYLMFTAYFTKVNIHLQPWEWKQVQFPKCGLLIWIPWSGNILERVYWHMSL